MKILLTCCIILTVVFAATSCTSRAEVREDLARYAEDMLKITPLEAEGIKAYQGAVGKNYKNDARLRRAIRKRALPKLKRFRSKLDEIHPITEKINELHETYKKKTDAYITAFDILLEALKERDEEMIKKANSYLSQTEEYHLAWEKEIKKLRE